MRRPRVLDSSSIFALFHGHPATMEMLEMAAAGERMLLLPAAAIARANEDLKAAYSAWDIILRTPNVHVMALDGSTAIEIGAWPGDLDARHAFYEAKAVQGIIVTRDPALYKPGDVPLLVV